MELKPMPFYKAPQLESDLWSSREVLNLKSHSAAMGEPAGGSGWGEFQTAKSPGHGPGHHRRADTPNVHTMWADEDTKKEQTNSILLAENTRLGGSTEPPMNEEDVTPAEAPANEDGSSQDQPNGSEKETPPPTDQRDQENKNEDEEKSPKRDPISPTPVEIPLPADKETKNPGQQCKPKSPKDPLPEYPLDYGLLEDPKYVQTFSDEQLRLIAEWWVMCLTTNPEKRPAPTCKAQELARQEIARRQKKNGQSIDAVLSQARAYDSRLRRILSADGAEDVAGKPAMAQLERFIEELECERQGNVSAIRNGPEYYKNRLQQILVEVKAATKDYLE